jgi:hypothetical protein
MRHFLRHVWGCIWPIRCLGNGLSPSAQEFLGQSMLVRCVGPNLIFIWLNVGIVRNIHGELRKFMEVIFL